MYELQVFARAALARATWCASNTTRKTVNPVWYESYFAPASHGAVPAPRVTGPKTREKKARAARVLSPRVADMCAAIASGSATLPMMVCIITGARTRAIPRKAVFRREMISSHPKKNAKSGTPWSTAASCALCSVHQGASVGHITSPLYSITSRLESEKW